MSLHEVVVLLIRYLTLHLILQLNLRQPKSKTFLFGLYCYCNAFGKIIRATSILNFSGYNLIEIVSHSYLFCMTKNTNDYFYIDYMPQRKSKKFRCRIQLNGVRWIEYFETKEEAEAYKLELFEKRTKSYRKGNHQYFSLFYIFNEWLKDKKLEWADSTYYSHKLTFEKTFYSLKDKWFHLITFEDCMGLLHKAEGNINCGKYYYSFQCLQEMNKFSLNKYGYSLSWDVSTIRKKIKITKGANKKPREYHTLDEIKAISSFLKNNTNKRIRNTEELYHIFLIKFLLNAKARLVRKLPPLF